MDMRVVRSETKREEWKSIILACRSSGQSVRTWCREHGIKESSYYYWLKEIRHELLILRNEESSLTPVTPVFCELPSVADDDGVSVQLPGLQLQVEKTASLSVV
jgi:transposase-like protein